MSTPSRSASCRASALGRTLKPTTSAFEADARLTSFSVIPPTPVWITLTRTSGCWIFPELADQRLDGALDVALEDDVEVLHAAGLHLLEERLERHAAVFERCASCSRRRRSARFSAMSFAWRSCSTTRESSPAGGGRSKPRISTGSPGRASLTFSPR